MKHVVSVSLGSSHRNGQALQQFGGYDFLIERVGTDGSIKQAKKLIQEYDGKVDAIGLGGTDLYIYAGGRRYQFKETTAIAASAHKTPVVDGSGIKNTLERRVAQYLSHNHDISLQHCRVLLVCAVDRFGMAQGFAEAGAEIVCGDLMFGFGVPFPIRSLAVLDRLARCIAPVITKLPVRWFYPTGNQQNRSQPRFREYFDEAAIIAGDFHFIKRYAPEDLQGKVIVTNTVTMEDEAELKARGVKTLVTTTPEIGGRSYGTNLLEAILITLAAKNPQEMGTGEYENLLESYNLVPRVKMLLH